MRKLRAGENVLSKLADSPQDTRLEWLQSSTGSFIWTFPFKWNLEVMFPFPGGWKGRKWNWQLAFLFFFADSSLQNVSLPHTPSHLKAALCHYLGRRCAFKLSLPFFFFLLLLSSPPDRRHVCCLLSEAMSRWERVIFPLIWERLVHRWQKPKAPQGRPLARFHDGRTGFIS